MMIGEKIILLAAFIMLKYSALYIVCRYFDHQNPDSEGWKKSLWSIIKIRKNYLNFADLPNNKWGDFVRRLRIYDFIANLLFVSLFIAIFLSIATYENV